MAPDEDITTDPRDIIAFTEDHRNYVLSNRELGRDVSPLESMGIVYSKNNSGYDRHERIGDVLEAIKHEASKLGATHVFNVKVFRMTEYKYSGTGDAYRPLANQDKQETKS